MQQQPQQQQQGNNIRHRQPSGDVPISVNQAQGFGVVDNRKLNPTGTPGSLGHGVESQNQQAQFMKQQPPVPYGMQPVLIQPQQLPPNFPYAASTMNGGQRGIYVAPQQLANNINPSGGLLPGMQHVQHQPNAMPGIMLYPNQQIGMNPSFIQQQQLAPLSTTIQPEVPAPVVIFYYS